MSVALLSAAGYDMAPQWLADIGIMAVSLVAAAVVATVSAYLYARYGGWG